MALLYQRETGPRIRATLSSYFTIGALVSLAALAAVDRYGAQEVALSFFLVPAVLAGDRLARRVRRFVDRAGVRPFVLGFSFLSALGVLYRALS